MIPIFGSKSLKSSFIVQLLLLAIACCQAGNTRIKREPIINGSEKRISKVPYFASIVDYDSEFQQWVPVCGATIISNKWILTAAHCITGPTHRLKIRTGYDQYFSPKDDNRLHDIFNVIPHAGYVFGDFVNDNDIGLINLTKPMNCVPNLQMPIALPTKAFDIRDGLKLNILGFGLKSTVYSDKKPALPFNLLSGTVKVMNQNDCHNLYSKWNIKDHDHHFCATSRKCEVAIGDSGGPAIANSQVIGIISTGGMKLDKYPGLYIDVRKYVDWIKNKVGSDLRDGSQYHDTHCNIL